MHVDGCSFSEAVEQLSGRVTAARPRPSAASEANIASTAARAASAANDDARQLKRATAIWNEATPIAGTDGEAYLARRGIELDDVPDHGGLRWHPRCSWEAGIAPCVVARYTHVATVEPCGILRRPITGEKPKALGPNAGCVIRLWPDDAVELGLVLGEGVETVLAAATRILHRGTYLRPSWAAGSTSNMAAFPALSGVESLTLLVDHDRNGAGKRAADQCERRWLDAGREVIRLMPGDLGDFNDLVKP
jgi:putative DNA primase/helicase